MSKVPSRWRFSEKALKLEVFTLTAALAVLGRTSGRAALYFYFCSQPSCHGPCVEARAAVHGPWILYGECHSPDTGRAWKHGRPCVVSGFCMESAILLTRAVRGSTGGRVSAPFDYADHLYSLLN